jgi:hypothetical protein
VNAAKLAVAWELEESVIDNVWVSKVGSVSWAAGWELERIVVDTVL